MDASISTNLEGSKKMQEAILEHTISDEYIWSKFVKNCNIELE